MIWELQVSKSIMGNSVEAMEMGRGLGSGCNSSSSQCSFMP